MVINQTGVKTFKVRGLCLDTLSGDLVTYPTHSVCQYMNVKVLWGDYYKKDTWVHYISSPTVHLLQTFNVIKKILECNSVCSIISEKSYVTEGQTHEWT